MDDLMKRLGEIEGRASTDYCEAGSQYNVRRLLAALRVAMRQRDFAVKQHLRDCGLSNYVSSFMYGKAAEKVASEGDAEILRALEGEG